MLIKISPTDYIECLKKALQSSLGRTSETVLPSCGKPSSCSTKRVTVQSNILLYFTGSKEKELQYFYYVNNEYIDFLTSLPSLVGSWNIRWLPYCSTYLETIKDRGD